MLATHPHTAKNISLVSREAARHVVTEKYNRNGHVHVCVVNMDGGIKGQGIRYLCRVSDFEAPFATITTLFENGVPSMSWEWCWEAVARCVGNGGALLI